MIRILEMKTDEVFVEQPRLVAVFTEICCSVKIFMMQLSSVSTYSAIGK
jgi:hypothetical protein